MQVNLVVVVPIEGLAALGAGDVVAPFALAAVAGHGGRVLVASAAVPAREGQQLIPAARNDVKILACKRKPLMHLTHTHTHTRLWFFNTHTRAK